MTGQIVFVNGKSKCGCVMEFSSGDGEYSDVHSITPCAAHSGAKPEVHNHWPRLQEQDLNALLRFNETCEDSEGYDIGAEAMGRLVEIGLASKGPHGIRSITPFGQWVIDAREGEVDLEPLKTEEDNIAESALRIARLRKGAAL